MEVTVTDYSARGIDRALLLLKRKLANEGIFREWKRHVFYEKPSQHRKRKRAESQRRRAKEEQRRFQRQTAAEARRP